VGSCRRSLRLTTNRGRPHSVSVVPNYPTISDLLSLIRRIYEESLCCDVFTPAVIDALMVEWLVSSARRIETAKRIMPGWVQQIAAEVRRLHPSVGQQSVEMRPLISVS
jgi:hypothetical protein